MRYASLINLDIIISFTVLLNSLLETYFITIKVSIYLEAMSKNRFTCFVLCFYTDVRHVIEFNDIMKIHMNMFCDSSFLIDNLLMLALSGVYFAFVAQPVREFLYHAEGCVSSPAIRHLRYALSL